MKKTDIDKRELRFMKLDDDYDYEFDYEEHHGKISMGAMVVVVSLFVLAVLVVVLLVNSGSRRRRNPAAEETEEVIAAQELDEFGYPKTSDLVEGSGIKPDDLDFWDMYPKESTQEPESDTPTREEKEKAGEEQKKTETESSSEEPKTTEDDPANDGKHTLIEYADGTTEWVVISPYLAKNTYDFTRLVSSDDEMKYVEDGKNTAFMGVDISKYQEEVDFNQLKDAGVDYVMLRVGARGYSSGQIMMDEYFTENLQKATEAGLDIGVYFFSQAITEAEAIEEASVVIQNLQGFTIKYPVAIDMEYVDNDTSRLEQVSRADKTVITKAFLDTVQAAGYRPMIYGNKEWLLKRIDLSKLTAYDIWLAQEKDMPDYPYKFTMWQYTTSGKVNGIRGYADLNICFIDYSAK